MGCAETAAGTAFGARHLGKIDEDELLDAEVPAEEGVTVTAGHIEPLCNAFSAARVSISCQRVGGMTSGAGTGFAFFWLAVVDDGRSRFFFG